MNSEHLETYLNDHYAGSVAGVELTKRCLGNNSEGALGMFLRDVLADIEADQASLEDVIGRLDMRLNKAKTATAWLGEKVTRLKLNDKVLEYSDLSRLEELEALLLGIRGKLALWNVLETALADDVRVADIDFSELGRRAEKQLEGAESHHREAAKRAFLGSD